MASSFVRLHPRLTSYQPKLTCRELQRRSFNRVSFGVWHVKQETKVPALAAALFGRTMNETAKSAASTGVDGEPGLVLLEAMGAPALSRAMNAMALCNRFLERPKEPSIQPSSFRVAFVPVNHVFVRRTDADVGNPLERGPDELRRSVKLQLRLVPCPSRGRGGQDSNVDVIKVAAQTNVTRLSGTLAARWAESQEISASPPVLLQAMGPGCINTMVRALALSWQKSARCHEADGGDSQPGFACLPSHIQLPDDAEGKFSAVQCELLRA